MEQVDQVLYEYTYKSSEPCAFKTKLIQFSTLAEIHSITLRGNVAIPQSGSKTTTQFDTYRQTIMKNDTFEILRCILNSAWLTRFISVFIKHLIYLLRFEGVAVLFPAAHRKLPNVKQFH